jgi:transcriptional regulator with XRE-family HTH domain
MTPPPDNSDVLRAAGRKLRQIREGLGLRFRDVEQASQQIADRLGNRDYEILISRLSDIENQGTLPTIFKLYALCVIYKLDFRETLGWYGIPAE